MGSRRGLLWRSIAPLLTSLGELPPEAAFNAEIPLRNGMVKRRRHFQDLPLLRVYCQFAAHPAIRTDRVGLGLLSLIPRPRGSHVVLGLEHQRARWAYTDAVAAIDARGFWQRNIELRGNMRGKA